MPQFNDWCDSNDGQVGNHFRRVITGRAANLVAGIQATAAIIPGHYASEEHVARALRRLGKPGAAALIEGKLPTTKAIRSGDLGEIFATEWIDTHSGGYHAPIKRLRWKDHRNMAMRGEDVIGILQDPQTQRLHFLKTEAKSRATLTAQVAAEARANLDKDGDFHRGMLFHLSRRACLNSAMNHWPMRLMTLYSSTEFCPQAYGIFYSHSLVTPQRRC